MIIKGCEIVKNANVYGLEESIRGAKFPMATDINVLTNELTSGIEKLAKAAPGEGHDQWLTGVVVQFDLIFSIKAWTEAERYHFLDFISSQSTMHKISKLDIDECCNEYVMDWNKCSLELLRDKYLRSQDPEDYLRLLYNVPVGFRLTARMTTNYRQLKTIYRQRKTHRLPEWRRFCEWIETLPMSELITGKEKEE